MPHFVFANDNEIASKSADGASIACQPDVCFSPGAPYPGVPVPYPNSVFARDLTNLSKTVFVKGTGAALENKSYFSTSYGDEPATQAYKKGIISQKITGKGYFASWSMDVKFEKLGVARHMDFVTHNHGSPANALVQKYRSVWNNAAGPCGGPRGDRAKMEAACKPDNDDDANKKRKLKRKRSILQTLKNVLSLADEVGQATTLYTRNRNNAWMEDYCDGLWIKPSSSAKDFMDAKEKLDAFLDQGMTGIIQDAFGKILELARENLTLGEIARQVGWSAVKLIFKNVVGGAAGTTGIGLVVTGAMAAWSVADIVMMARNLAQKLGPDAMKYLEDINAVDQIVDKLKEKLQRWQENPEEFMADAMTAQAALDPCIRARKCMLIPFNRTDNPANRVRGARDGSGCCPGQTGHHVMPGDMFGRNAAGVPANPCGTAYNNSRHNNAPTMCLEGANNSHGSHGLAHSALSTSIRAYRASATQNPPMISYEQARDQAVLAVKIVAPQCDAECIKAQLDAYYADCNKGAEKNLLATSGSKPGADGPVGNSN